MTEDKPCENHEIRIEHLEKQMEKIELILDKVRNRLPMYASLGFAALTLLIGWLLK